MACETITQALRRSLVDSDKVADLAQRLKAKHGWKGTQRAAHRRLLQMLNDGYSGAPRHFPANDIPDAIEIAGEDLVSPILERASLKGQRDRLERELAALDKKAPMRSVRHRREIEETGS